MLSDTSAGIVANLLERELPEERPGRFRRYISSDAFSIDGLLGILAFLSDSRQYDEVLQEVARTALYQYGSNRDLAHVVFVLNAWMDRQRSPLKESIFDLSDSECANVLYEELIPRFFQILQRIDRFQGYWQDEEERLAVTEQLLESGRLAVVETSDLDLAVFAINPAEFSKDGQFHGSAQAWPSALHRLALHTATSCTRILLQNGRQYFFYCRPDSLAACHQTLLPQRPDLKGLADVLSNKEGKTDCWPGDPTDNLWASLSTSAEKESSMDVDTLLVVFRDFMTCA
jgi:hypothetical protein